MQGVNARVNFDPADVNRCGSFPTRRTRKEIIAAKITLTTIPMHIRKLMHHRNHIRKQNISDAQIITLNNYINKQIHKHKKHLKKIS